MGTVADLPGGMPATRSVRSASPRGWQVPGRAARRVWWMAAVVVNVALLPLALTQHATEASLAAVLLTVLARHDGLVSTVGRRVAVEPGYRLHQLLNHLGQLHRAMALTAVGWMLVAALQQLSRPATAAILAGPIVGLTAMGWSARDAVRGARHERFELMHRCVGWSVLGVLVAVVAHRFGVGLATGQPAGAVPAVLLLTAVVGVVAQPWTSVRRLPVDVLVVTPGLVVLALPGRRRVGEFVRVSLEGREWHAFAASTCGREGADRFCLVIRRAGNWTEQLGRRCENGTPPTWLLVRTQRGYGFMGAAQAYRRVLVIATGAGIGPVLIYLLDRRQPGLHCVWIARDPRSSIGSDLVDRVLAEGQTTLVDTFDARPDLAQLVTASAVGAEAVFVVSNATVRDQVAAVCSDLGVPWYGPTFDS